MTNLESYLLHRNLACEEMEIVKRKILLVCRLRIITMTHIQDIVLYILLNHEPGTTAKAQALALADGMKPQPLVLAYTLARFHLDDIARFFAQITADIIIIIYLSQEADSLAVLALGIYQMLLFGYLANLILDMMADRENRFFSIASSLSEPENRSGLLQDQDS